MNAPILVFVLATTVCGQMPEEFQYHFRETVFDHPDLKLIGPNVLKYTKPEPGGLRVTWTAEEATNSAIGVGSTLSLRGDFEITTRFEILKVDPVKVGYGAGVRFYAKLASTPEEALSMGRVLLGSPPRELYVVNHVKSPSQKGEKDKLFRKGFPAPGKTGQMRLTRKGKVLSFHVSDKDDGFRELASTPCATDDVINMSFTGWTGGGGKGALDVRLVELKIRADEMPGRSQPAPVTPPPPTQEFTSWWLVFVFLGIVLLVGLGVGIWLWSRQKGETDEDEEDEDQED